MYTKDTIENFIKWHSRRGMLEIDIIINNYIKKSAFSKLTFLEKITFLEMLKNDDTLIMQWIITNKTMIPKRYKNIIKKIIT